MFSNDIATMQLALECAWLVTKICGNSLQVKKKKKSAWSATYWENDEERARPLCTDRSAALRPQWLSSARARSPELGAAGGHGSNKGLTGRSVQEGTAVEVQWPSGARAMGYSFIGSYQSASGALPLCDRRPSGASGLKCASFHAFYLRGGDEGSSTSKPPLKGGNCVRP